MLAKIQNLFVVVILGMFLLCAGISVLRGPRRQPVTSPAVTHVQPRPTATLQPSPTPRQPIDGPAAEELRTKWDELTDLQRSTYRREILGTYVRWTTEVVEVHPTGTVNALTMAGTKALVIVFDLPLSEARKLNKKQEITIEGTIRNVELPGSDGGGFLEELAKSLSLVVHLRDVVVLVDAT